MELFEQCIQERVYLKGVSLKAVISSRCAFQTFSGATKSKPAMMQRIKELREKGNQQDRRWRPISERGMRRRL